MSDGEFDMDQFMDGPQNEQLGNDDFNFEAEMKKEQKKSNG